MILLVVMTFAGPMTIRHCKFGEHSARNGFNPPEIAKSTKSSLISSFFDSLIAELEIVRNNLLTRAMRICSFNGRLCKILTSTAEGSDWISIFDQNKKTLLSKILIRESNNWEMIGNYFMERIEFSAQKSALFAHWSPYAFGEKFEKLITVQKHANHYTE